ncbi:hypothetical protein CMN23_01855 [Candidatus Saccharibacteria bacterium]|nr:hypothetical protein [Candidatus Saccharibacteria bacterium]|tara:strand:+ start:252 stop:572 length:321 start_codon:yes stop_codon:yes gene_type:complete
MATTKKTVKKSAPAKAAPRKTVAKKAPARKSPAKKRTTSKKTASQQMRSFKVYTNDTKTFRKVRFTRQTLYWTILLAVIMITQFWILNIQLEISQLTNELISSQYE